MMNQRQSQWNTGNFHPQPSEMNMSRIEPYQYDSSSTAQMSRSNAWEPATATKTKDMNQTTNENSQFR
jgi:hypothetical protein